MGEAPKANAKLFKEHLTRRLIKPYPLMNAAYASVSPTWDKMSITPRYYTSRILPETDYPPQYILLSYIIHTTQQ